MKSYPKNGRVYFHTENDMIKKLDNPEQPAEVREKRLVLRKFLTK